MRNNIDHFTMPLRRTISEAETCCPDRIMHLASVIQSHFTPMETFNRTYSSRDIKDVIELSENRWTPNGVVIAAFIKAGFKYHRIDNKVYFNIRSQDVINAWPRRVLVTPPYEY